MLHKPVIEAEAEKCKLHNSKIGLCSHSHKEVWPQCNSFTVLLPSLLTAINTEEFRHTSMLMTCKGTRKNILKSLKLINFMSGAVLIAPHAVLHLIFKGSALKYYDYLYYFYIIPLLSIVLYDDYIVSSKYRNKIPFDSKVFYFFTKGLDSLL